MGSDKQDEPSKEQRELSRRRFLRNAGVAAAAVPLYGGLADILSEQGASAATYKHNSDNAFFASHPKYHFVMVNHVTTNSFFTATIYGIQDACALTGCSYQWTGSASSIVNQMVSAFTSAIAVKAKGINFVDVGTSGGIWGMKEGYSMMVGGDKDVVEKLRPIFETLAPAPDLGWGYVGPTGAGHYVKMIHNGIEYGLMQAYAEGFQIMKAKKDFALDVHQIAEIWRYGSVVRSWLLDLTANALAEDPNLTHVKGWVADSGEGRWTVADAIELDVPAPVITLSLMMRFVSREDDSYAAKLLAAMRNQFGGHAIKAE